MFDSPGAPETEAIETPLHYFRGGTSAHGEPGIVIREAPLMAHLNLRGDPDDNEFLRGVDAVLGIALPTQPSTCAHNGEAGIYWLGPDEWLLIVEGGRAAALEEQLRQQLGGHISIVDVSGGQTLLNISGNGAAMVLMKSSPYDFHTANFGPGCCVQTTFAKATALVVAREDGCFDLVIRRSFADYLARWILDAGAEAGVIIS